MFTIDAGARPVKDLPWRRFPRETWQVQTAIRDASIVRSEDPLNGAVYVVPFSVPQMPKNERLPKLNLLESKSRVGLQEPLI